MTCNRCCQENCCCKCKCWKEVCVRSCCHRDWHHKTRKFVRVRCRHNNHHDDSISTTSTRSS